MMQIKDGVKFEDSTLWSYWSPPSQGVHYGQSVFEGLKAYKRDGEVALSVLKKILSVFNHWLAQYRNAF